MFICCLPYLINMLCGTHISPFENIVSTGDYNGSGKMSLVSPTFSSICIIQQKGYPVFSGHRLDISFPGHGISPYIHYPLSSHWENMWNTYHFIFWLLTQQNSVCFTLVSPKLGMVSMTPQRWSHILSRHFHDMFLPPSGRSVFVAYPLLVCLETLLDADHVLFRQTRRDREIVLKTFDKKIGLDGNGNDSYTCIVVLHLAETHRTLITAYPVRQEFLLEIMFAKLAI